MITNNRIETCVPDLLVISVIPVLLLGIEGGKNQSSSVTPSVSYAL